MCLIFRLGALTDAIITQHASLAGIAQQLAEIYYIGQAGHLALPGFCCSFIIAQGALMWIRTQIGSLFSNFVYPVKIGEIRI